MEAERRYIDQWMDMGFPPETVALAYERTVFYKKDLNWRYLNGAPCAAGTTPAGIRPARWRRARRPAKRPRCPPVSPAAPAGDKDAWMRRYIKR